MADRLNMSLDDVIKQDKTNRRGGRGGGRRGGEGRQGGEGRGGNKQRSISLKRPVGGRKFNRPVRPANGRGAERRRNIRSDQTGSGKGLGTRPSFIRRTGAADKARPDRPRREEISRERETDSRPVIVKSRTMLKVSNLDNKITNTELFELFSAVGSLIRCQIDYDNLGRSKHTAKIEFESPMGARKAIEEYNGNVLDGKTLEVKYADIQKEVPRIRRREEFRREERDIPRRFERREGNFGGRRAGSGFRGNNRFNRRRPREDSNKTIGN